MVDHHQNTALGQQAQYAWWLVKYQQQDQLHHAEFQANQDKGIGIAQLYTMMMQKCEIKSVYVHYTIHGCPVETIQIQQLKILGQNLLLLCIVVLHVDCRGIPVSNGAQFPFLTSLMFGSRNRSLKLVQMLVNSCLFSRRFLTLNFPSWLWLCVKLFLGKFKVGIAPGINRLRVESTNKQI